jgi:hypothetical protein
LFHQAAEGCTSPVLGRALLRGLRDWDAERGEAVEDGDADLEFGGLAVEVSGDELPAGQLDAVRRGLGAVAAMVAGQTAPERAAEML